MIEFYYQALLHIDIGNVFQILPVANLLQMDGVQEACCQFLASQLHPSNCLGIRNFAYMHNCHGTLEKFTLFMQQRFPEIAPHEEFCIELNFEEVKYIISDSNLNVHGEEQVYEASMAWLMH